MKRMLAVSMLLMLFMAEALAAGQAKEIELTDGSVLSGEIVSFSNGKYTIRTESMGTILIDDAKVRAIRAKGAATGPSDPTPGRKSLQERMLSDQEVLDMIRSLKDDPAFQRALEDPEIMNALNSGDVGALTANPRFLQLLENAAVRAIQKKLAP